MDLSERNEELQNAKLQIRKLKAQL